ncbi:MAG: ROK family protein [Limisphaerales bacterium]
MAFFLGIEIGGTKLQIVVGEHHADQWKIVQRFRSGVSREAGADGIRKEVERALSQLLPQFAIQAIGVGFGGPVDWRTGTICCSHQIEGWSEFPLSEWLNQRAGVPVFVDNDANVAAFGEAMLGAGRGFDPAFYVTLGSGVGGGLVSGGKIYHGAKPGESEIGHLRLDKSGRIVEESCSGWAVDRKIRLHIENNPGSLLARLVGDANQGEAKFLDRALQESDPSVLRILNETAEDLAFGLSHVSHLFHPEAIIVGGGLSLLGEPLRIAVQEHLDGFVMKAFTPRPRVMIAQLLEDVVPVGALALASSQSKR